MIKADKKKTEIKRNNIDSRMKIKNEQKQEQNSVSQARNAEKLKAKTQQQFKRRNKALKSTINSPFMQKVLTEFFDEIGLDEIGRELLKLKLEGLPQSLILTVSS